MKDYRIVLSASKSFKKDTLIIADKLKDYEVIVPYEFTHNIDKRTASKMHFDEIASKNTDALLVINNTKNDTPNYIGANTMADIGLAFHYNKDIYLLNDYYEPFIEELQAWNVTPLRGHLKILEVLI